MIAENNEQIKDEVNPSNESQPIESSLPIPQPRITDDMKNLLNSLLKKTLDKRIVRLESRNQEQYKNITFTNKHYDNFKKILKSIVKNMEETLKKKETKKKNETPRKGRMNIGKHPLASKSVPPGKKIGIKTKDYNTSQITKKNIMSKTTNFETEDNIDPNKKTKSFKDKRILSEKNMKKGKMKLLKKTDNKLSPYRKEEEDIKAKTMSYYHTDKNNDSRRNINNITVDKSKNKEKDKKVKKSNELAKTFSEGNMTDKNKKKEKIIKSEKKEKNTISHLQTKSELKLNIKD